MNCIHAAGLQGTRDPDRLVNAVAALDAHAK